MLFHRLNRLEQSKDQVVAQGAPVIVSLRPWDVEIPFRVDFFRCYGTTKKGKASEQSGDADYLTHVQIRESYEPGIGTELTAQEDDEQEDDEQEDDGDEEKSDAGKKIGGSRTKRMAAYWAFWTDVVVYYQGSARRTIRDDRTLPQGEARCFRHSEILCSLALALRQKDILDRFRTISRKTLAAAAASDRIKADQGGGAYISEYGIGDLSGWDSYTGGDVERLARTFMVPDQLKEPDRLEKYFEFESRIIDLYGGLQSRCVKKPDSATWIRARLAAHIKSLGKSPDDTTTVNLHFFRNACDNALMDAYAYVHAEVMRHPEVRKHLDDASVKYNDLAHSVSDALGGLVPALHPLWALCLHAPSFVDALLGYVTKIGPEESVRLYPSSYLDQMAEKIRTGTGTDKHLAGFPSLEVVFRRVLPSEANGVEPGEELKAVNGAMMRLNNLFSDALIKYCRLVELEKLTSDSRKFVPAGEEGAELTEDYPDPSEFAAHLERLDKLRAHETEITADRDMSVFWDTELGNGVQELDKMSVKECALKNRCSIGEISKRKKRGQKKLQKLLARNGITRE